MRPAGITVRVAAAVVLGVLLAAVAQFFFFVADTAWLNLVVWAAVGLAIGAASRLRSTAVWADAVIGFTIVFSYSIMGYASSAPLLGALAPFALLALLGALGMAGTGLAGHSCRRLLRVQQRRREARDRRADRAAAELVPILTTRDPGSRDGNAALSSPRDVSTKAEHSE